ncbi:MAG: hypothetical protein IT379_37960 [Deltaproteobacteria bacterium]|nr:hypothetical protein [Deltaproteobacteria bacterium]
MDRVARERIGSALRWLGARSDRRLVEVVVSPESREDALAFVALAEHEGALPQVVLESPWTADGGFGLRADELVLRRDELADVARRAGVVLPEREPPTAEGSLSAGDRFVREIGDLLDALPRALEGIVVVLAPAFIEDARAMAESVALLVAGPALARARWVVVAHAPALGDLAFRLGGRAALTVDAVGDAQESAVRLADDLDRAAGADADAVGATRVGAASPRVGPPLRRTWKATDPLHPERSELPATPSRASKNAEPNEPTLFERVRVLVLRAAAASARGSFTTPLPPIREARDLCFLHGRDEDGIRLEIMLASYVAAAGAPGQAIQIYGDARTRAHEAELPALACQAELARASALAAVPDLPRASAAFADAGSYAEAARLPLLALEGYRLSGEAALAAGLEPQAAEAWARALAVAGEENDPALSPTTAEVAERLALVCDAHGLVSQAASLRARAEMLRGATTETPPQSEPLASNRAAPAASSEATALSMLAFTPTPQGATPPTTPAFREVSIADVPRNRVPAELKGTVRLLGDPVLAHDEDA